MLLASMKGTSLPELAMLAFKDLLLCEVHFEMVAAQYNAAVLKAYK